MTEADGVADLMNDRHPVVVAGIGVVETRVGLGVQPDLTCPRIVAGIVGVRVADVCGGVAKFYVGILLTRANLDE